MKLQQYDKYCDTLNWNRTTFASQLKLCVTTAEEKNTTQEYVDNDKKDATHQKAYRM